jgi:hypothetical protein
MAVQFVEKQRLNMAQDAFDFGDTEEANTKADAEKARQKARDFYTSDPEYAKKVTQREEAKKQDEEMRKIVKEKAAKKAALAQSSMISPSGNTTAAGRGTAYGGGDLEKGMQGGRMKKPSYAKGGKVKSASARADGCCIRGKTKA